MPRAERPLKADGSVLTEFAADLRLLREKAGSPPYRELAIRAHFSASTLAGAAAGQKLPTLEVTLAYVHACDGDQDEWTQRWHAAQTELRGDTTAVPDRTPYVGLAAFGVEEADRFFGRDKLVRQLCALVAARRFTAVIGPSGSGKSSLLHAGLLHARGTGAHGLEAGPAVVITPGARPAARLAAVPDDDRLLVVDQFEELFTLCQDKAERAEFIEALSRRHVVIGVRADFYAHCAAHPVLVEVLRDGQLLVGPMTNEELRAAIVTPAAVTGCRLEPALVDRVIEEAVAQPGVLPLVSHALLETWRRRRDGMLTVVGYQLAGGISEAIAQTAETAYRQLSPQQQQRAREVFVRLVALGQGTEDTKRRIERRELDAEADEVLEHLAAARLVTLDRTSVEITHEALIRRWPRLRAWLDDDRESLRRHRELTDATDVWESHDRDPGSLYRGTRLALARDLDRSSLTARERTFLDAAVTAEETELAAARTRSRRMRYLSALLAVLLVISTIATVRAVVAERDVTDQRNTALSQKVAAEAVSQRQTDPGLAAQLALAAYRLVPTPEARDGLISTLATPLTGHRDYVNAAQFTPDGTRIVTAARDRTLRVWNTAAPQKPLVIDTGHGGNIYSMAISPDGRTIATGSGDRTAGLWTIDGRRIATLAGHADAVYSVAFSRDGRTVATGSWDRTAKLWDVATGQEIATLTGFELNVKQVAFSPDGTTIAVSSDDRTVRFWDVVNPREPVPVARLATGHTDMVAAIAYRPDGRTFATGSDDRTAKLWDVHDRRAPREIATLQGHAEVIMSVAFSQDGRTVATAADDRTVRVWTVDDPAHPVPQAVLTGHNGPAQSVSFGPDGRMLTASTDHTAEVWTLDLGWAQRQACASPRRITEQEWNQRFPDVAFTSPC
ncbi:WD40 repeat domain-containing protein [Lentzea sp. NPDC005914]|uniref:WD40 repeat domain-containing protein n=1 Tax=Lentzea sp. NPDC005914 TaxID=3154572 RepID=UPI0033CA50BD